MIDSHKLVAVSEYLQIAAETLPTLLLPMEVFAYDDIIENKDRPAPPTKG